MAGLIDVGILKPELAGSFAAGYRGAEQARQESQQKQQQFEMNRMKLEQLKQDRAALTDLQAKLRARGQSDDPTFFFRSLIETGNPDYVAKGYEGLQRYSELQRADALLRREAPELFGPSSTAPTGAAPAARNALAPVVPEGDLVAAPIAPQTGVMREVAPGGAVGPETPLSYLKRQFGTPGAPASANALAPTVAAAPAAPATNVLAPAAAAPGTATPADANARIRELRNKILTYRSVNDPRLKSLADVYEAELKELTKTHTVGGRIVTGGGREIYTAPSQIGAIEAEIADLRQKGVKDNDPRIVARLGKIGQLSGAGAPLDITRAMAERDRLIASGRTAADPDVRALNDYIRKQTTHQPAAQQNVYAYTPASEVAQQDFMRGARATYDTLKNAPATLKNIEAAKELIPSAAGFMGPGGEPLLKAASFLNNRFGTSISTKGVTDATELRTRLFNGVIDNLRKLDAQPTAAQQQVLQDAIGNLGTDPSALPRVLDAMAQSVRDKVDLYNRDVTSAEQRGVRFPYKPQIDLPPPKSTPGAAAQQIPGAAPATAIPQAAINDLKAGRGTDEQFDAIFGAGAAKRVRGGK